MKRFLKVMLLTLLVLALSLFAEARVLCNINQINMYGHSLTTYSGRVTFRTGEEMNSWWEFWKDELDEKAIYASFRINKSEYIVKTEMRFSENIYKKFNEKYFQKIMTSKTSGYDQNNRKWEIIWRNLSTPNKKNR